MKMFEPLARQAQPKCLMQTAWIRMRHQVTRRPTRIQAFWHSDNIFTSFERHLNTLKIETDYDNLFGGLRVNVMMSWSNYSMYGNGLCRIEIQEFGQFGSKIGLHVFWTSSGSKLIYLYNIQVSLYVCLWSEMLQLACKELKTFLTGYEKLHLIVYHVLTHL